MANRILSMLWKIFNYTRKVIFGLLAIVLLVLLVVALVATRGPKVQSSTILVLRIEGNLVEELSSDAVARVVRPAVGQEQKETLVWDVTDALREAKDDRRVKAVLLDLNHMGDALSFGSVRIGALEEVKRAIQEFRKTGKKVIAAADSYTYIPYSLAVEADEIYLHTLGLVVLEGLGRFRDYYKDGLDRFEVEMNIVRVGEYKSAVEPFFRNEMSPEDRRAALEWMGDLWRSTVADLAAARKLKPAEIEAYTDQIASSLKRVEGDAARLALEAHLVDHVGPRDDVRKRLIELAGEDKETHSYKAVELHDYLRSLGKDRTEPPGGNRVVAVVVAKGDIVDGEQPPGTIGGDSTAEILRKARTDEKIKAIVLRVDSPGGSAMASELIREECARARKAGKPVVVSMGAVAASGGYWISTASDEIWASPNTITGSIGIFAFLPTVEKPLAKYLGVHADGVGTTPLAGAYRPDRPLDGEILGIFKQLIFRGYADFLARVAEARKKSPEEVDKIARGRVWSGRRAHEIGLVDKFGGLAEAIASAAERANLGKNYKVQFRERELSWGQKLIAGLAAAVIRQAELVRGGEAEASAPMRLLERIAGPLAKVARAGPASGIHAYCEECAEP